MIERCVQKAAKAKWEQKRGVTVMTKGQKVKVVTTGEPRRLQRAEMVQEGVWLMINETKSKQEKRVSAHTGWSKAN